jgi:hypothetical protein
VAPTLNSGEGSQPRRRLVPESGPGRAALVATAVAIGAWLVMPTITAAYRETYPVVDTWVMPAIAATLISLAALFNVFVVWRLRERSVLSIAAAVITIPLGLMFIVVLVAGALTGA